MDIKKNDIVLISSLSTIKLKIFKPFLLKRWPQQNIFVIRIIPPYKQEFDYSNDLPEKSFPCVIDPIWNFNRKKYDMLVNLNSENIKVIRRSVPIVLKEASNIMYLGDLWYSSVIGLSRAFSIASFVKIFGAIINRSAFATSVPRYSFKTMATTEHFCYSYNPSIQTGI